MGEIAEEHEAMYYEAMADGRLDRMIHQQAAIAHKKCMCQDCKKRRMIKERKEIWKLINRPSSNSL